MQFVCYWQIYRFTTYTYIYATSIHSTKKQNFWFIGLFLYDASICDWKEPHSTVSGNGLKDELTVGERLLYVHVLRRLLVHDSAQIEVLYRGAQENERRFLAFNQSFFPLVHCRGPNIPCHIEMHCYSLRTNCSNRRLLSSRSWVGQKRARMPWGTCRNEPMIWRHRKANCRL